MTIDLILKLLNLRLEILDFNFDFFDLFCCLHTNGFHGGQVLICIINLAIQPSVSVFLGFVRCASTLLRIESLSCSLCLVQLSFCGLFCLLQFVIFWHNLTEFCLPLL